MHCGIPFNIHQHSTLLEAGLTWCFDLIVIDAEFDEFTVIVEKFADSPSSTITDEIMWDVQLCQTGVIENVANHYSNLIVIHLKV